MAGVDLQILFVDSVFLFFIKNRIIISHILINKVVLLYYYWYK